MIGVPEGEEEEEYIENLFEKIMKENQQSGKGDRLPRIPESSESLKEIGPKEHTLGHIIIKLPKIKDKERIWKAAREKETVTYKGVPIRLSAHLS